MGTSVNGPARRCNSVEMPSWGRVWANVVTTAAWDRTSARLDAGASRQSESAAVGGGDELGLMLSPSVVSSSDAVGRFEPGDAGGDDAADARPGDVFEGRGQARRSGRCSRRRDDRFRWRRRSLQAHARVLPVASQGGWR